ncbi:glycoside hydrolase family 6 protein [Streptomyces sp. JH002]|uniref:glycoside hydrolase family 6 protein n=1 Tax=Streptomyces sp. JH002 TaxID=2763259 RepID=UPI003D8003D1
MRTPHTPHARSRTRPRLLFAAAAAALGGLLSFGPLAPAQGTAPQETPREDAAGLPAGTVFHNHPGAVHDWVAANPGDARRQLIEERIADQPQGIWFATYQPDSVTQDVAAVTGPAAAAGEVPVLVPYVLPDRDCGGASGGGAPDFPSYLGWTQGFAAGLGSDPVVVILEPDAIALTDCLDESQVAQRFSALGEAAGIIHAANPQARVYFDAGHSGWHSPSVIAQRLRDAGAVAQGDGIYTNTSNYHTTADETAFAEAVLGQLGDPALQAVIDTSRNGNGPRGSEWCDPVGRLVGESPTVNTGSARVDAYLWIKRPGELDGCAGPAGQFSPEYAFELAGG